MIPQDHTTKSRRKNTALIAGGGVAGLASAILLDELGYHVTLVEKRNILGGRTYSFTDKITGQTVDNGQHLLMGAYHETLRYLEKIGAKHKVEILDPTTVPLHTANGQHIPFIYRGGKSPALALMRAFLSWQGFRFTEKLALIKLWRKLHKIKTGRKCLPHDQTVTEWLQKLGQGKSARKNFWDIITLATLNDNPDITSADGLATILIKSFLGGDQDGFLILPRTGLTDLFVEPAEKYLTLRGHHIIRGVRLAHIDMSDRVHSFKFSDGSVCQADVYIAALPCAALLKALPDNFTASHAELNALKNAPTSPIVSINLFFDRPVMHIPFIGSANTRVHWFFNKDCVPENSPSRKIAPSQSRPLTRSHIVGVISAAYAYLNKNKTQIVEMALHDLSTLFPQAQQARLVHALVNKEKDATLSLRPGINSCRPCQKMTDNFFAVGDWTQTGLPCTIESAIVSAKKMAEQISSHPPPLP